MLVLFISRYRYCYLIGLSVGEHDTWFMVISVGEYHGYLLIVVGGDIGGSVARFMTAHLCFHET
jgi:hypothetical protein